MRIAFRRAAARVNPSRGCDHLWVGLNVPEGFEFMAERHGMRCLKCGATTTTAEITR